MQSLYYTSNFINILFTCIYMEIPHQLYCVQLGGLASLANNECGPLMKVVMLLICNIYSHTDNCSLPRNDVNALTHNVSNVECIMPAQ